MIVYTEGFEFLGIKFAWKKKILYRLPVTKNGREYGLRIVPKIKITDKIKGYRICRQKKSLQQVRRMTKIVNFTIEEIRCKECA